MFNREHKSKGNAGSVKYCAKYTVKMEHLIKRVLTFGWENKKRVALAGGHSIAPKTTSANAASAST